jgi:hypothetical protein
LDANWVAFLAGSSISGEITEAVTTAAAAAQRIIISVAAADWHYVRFIHSVGRCHFAGVFGRWKPKLLAQ